MTLRFAELLSRATELDGQTVKVAGRLAVTLHDAYLIDPDTPLERWAEQRVLLDHPGLLDLLLTTVPARGGSELAYFDHALIHGRLRASPRSGCDPALSALSLLIVEQAGKTYPVDVSQT